MKYFLQYLIYSFILLAQINFAQQFGKGLLLDDSLYVNSPIAAPLMRGDYSNLPEKYSLKEFAPTPGNQGSYSTCVGWASAYAARTILEAIRYKWNKREINENVFSPSFIYNQIRFEKNCSSGTSLLAGLEILKKEGCEKLSEFTYDCNRNVNSKDSILASKYRIIEYREIINRTTLDKTVFVKKSISNNRPVVIAMLCPPSFDRAGDLWQPDKEEYKSNLFPGHALTIIGYDDNKYNGAFEIINSWGVNWGNKGFTWIKYSDFEVFCKLGFEVLDKDNIPANVPDLSGELNFRLSNEQPMKSHFNGRYFEMDKYYPAGTLFELRINNEEPAYVYAFSANNNFKTYKIFPFNEKMVAYLPYRQNNIAIPDEDHYNMIDTAEGKSYYVFLYSKVSLDIDKIMTGFEKESGTFYDKIISQLKDQMVDNDNIKIDDRGKIKFNAISDGKEIVPILVEFNK